MSVYQISYLLTTYNKLPYLKQVMERLVAARLPDEEIIVADGGSTDGSAVYLQNLLDQGKIQQFTSERDRGEAHGFNKCVLKAHGEILKFITDDDAFNYPIIRACAKFMYQHPEIDVMLGHCGEVAEANPTTALIKESQVVEFNSWLQHRHPFWMIGLPLIVRRSAIPYLGLFSTGTILVDAEYTYRISSLKANIAWCTALISIHMGNPNGNSNRMGNKRIDEEVARMRNFFVKYTRPSTVQVAHKVFEASKRPLRTVKRTIFDRMGWAQYQNPELYSTNHVPQEGETHLDVVYRVCDELMEAQNKLRATEFIYHNKHSVDTPVK